MKKPEWLEVYSCISAASRPLQPLWGCWEVNKIHTYLIRLHSKILHFIFTGENRTIYHMSLCHTCHPAHVMSSDTCWKYFWVQLPEVWWSQWGCQVWYHCVCTETKKQTCAYRLYVATQLYPDTLHRRTSDRLFFIKINSSSTQCPLKPQTVVFTFVFMHRLN